MNGCSIESSHHHHHHPPLPSPHHHNVDEEEEVDPLLPFTPPSTIPQATRVRQWVGDRMRYVLLPEGPEVISYALDSVLVDMPRKGVTLFLATPFTRPHLSNLRHTVSDTPTATTTREPSISSSSSNEVKPSVVIKAIRHHHLHHHHASTCGPSTLMHDPYHEVWAMQHLPRDHHVIPLLDCLQDEHFVYLVLPYLSGGDLCSLVQHTGGVGLPEDQVRVYLSQMCEGLLCLKRQGMAHHDVSLENFMVDSEGQLEVIDLGMSLCCCHEGCSCMVSAGGAVGGKPAYISPQVAMGREQAYDPFAADVWSLGVCLYAMLTGHPLYNSPRDMAFKIMSAHRPGADGGAKMVVEAYDRGEGSNFHLSPSAKDLVCRMLHADPRHRPTLEEVLAHPFLVNHHHTTTTTHLVAASSLSRIDIGSNTHHSLVPAKHQQVKEDSG